MTSIADPLDLPSGIRLPNRIAKAAMTEALGNGWNEDQIHRLARGKEPDLDRGSLRTARAIMRRNGRISARSQRGIA